MENNERLTMTIPEFAKATGCSRNLAYLLARQNRLNVPVIFLGDKRMVVSRKAVLALLEGTGQKPEGQEREVEMRRDVINLEPKMLKCKICGDTFVFSAGEQNFYQDRSLAEPRRCPACRRNHNQRGVENEYNENQE